MTRKLFGSNGDAFGLLLLPEIPSDIDSGIKSFGDLIDLFDVGFSAAGLWEKLVKEYPCVWNEAYENPIKISHRLAHRLHDERTRALSESEERARITKGWHPSEDSLHEAKLLAIAGLGTGTRHWSDLEQRQRIVARYLCQVLHY